MQEEDRVAAALEGRLDPGELTDEEHAVWEEAFIKLMGEPGPEGEAFFARHRKLGLGVGVDEEGKLVYAKPED